MNGKLFKTIKTEFQECNNLPERAKEILNSVVTMFLYKSKQLFKNK